MFQVQVEGVEQTISKMNQIARAFGPQVGRAIEEVGSNAIHNLNQEFPDLTFEGHFFPANLEFWIATGGIVICKATGRRVDTSVEGIGLRTQESEGYGIQSLGKPTFTKEFNLDAIVNQIGKEATLKIKQRIIELLEK
jgi:hypothetical protein